MQIFSKMQDILYKQQLSGIWKHGWYDRFENGKHHIVVRGSVGYNDDEIVPLNEETAYLEETNQSYVPWKPVQGKMVAVRDSPNVEWSARVFIRKEKCVYVCVPFGMSWARYCNHPDKMEENWNYAEPFKKHFDTEE